MWALIFFFIVAAVNIFIFLKIYPKNLCYNFEKLNKSQKSSLSNFPQTNAGSK